MESKIFLKHNTLKRIYDTVYFLVGVTIAIPGILVFVLAAIPAILYRNFVLNVLSKTSFSPEGLGKIITPGFGTAYGLEYLFSVHDNPKKPSRNTTVHWYLTKGKVPLKEVKHLVQKNWLEAKIDNGNLQYPELQQYLVSWMGYLFWKLDSEFDLQNHLFLCPPITGNYSKYAEEFPEKLLNMPWKKHQSPWDIHISHSCSCNTSSQNSDLNPSAFCQICHKEEATLISIRTHHCLGDGISTMFASCEYLFECKLMGMDDKAKMSENVYKGIMKPKEKCSLFVKLFKSVTATTKHFAGLCRDLGFILVFILFRLSFNSPVHLWDKDKKWSMFTQRSRPVKLSTLKQIKNNFGVSLSSVLVSCASAALSKRVSKLNLGVNRNLVCGLPVPLPGHPTDKLINLITYMICKFPMDTNLDCVSRLEMVGQATKEVGNSLVTRLLFPWLVKLMSFHVVPIARFGLSNKMVPTSVSNVALPCEKPYVINHTYPVEDIGFTIGGNEGVNGAIFLTICYKGDFRFICTVDEAVMSKSELDELLKDMMYEVNALQKHVLCTEKS